ncbi:hypothetical protein B0A55_05034 [Friedmanniomyces simplex]|uniref:Protein transport protein sec16 n=1 Tax=Friedmanniomyces simplex TaxID=329884 RepID=A0A4U0XFM1_9PEZI|nr:hypothetical protein B0A55_05034 [Friedmanniomyces simplex]
MDDEEQYPNFTAAYPTSATTDASAQSASWHPAHRPNDHGVERVLTRESGGAVPADSDDDFFERYPGATPKKQLPPQDPQPQSSVPAEGAEDDEGIHDAEGEDEDEGEVQADHDGLRRGSISVHHMLDVRHHDASQEELARGATSFAEAEGPIREHLHESEEGFAPAHYPSHEGAGGKEEGEDDGEEDDDDEAQVFGGPDESMEEQERELEHFMPEHAETQSLSTEEAGEGVQHVSTPAAPSPEQAEGTTVHPEQLYEHQGEMTEMEMALDEEPDAPLLEDEEAPPTIIGQGDVGRGEDAGENEDGEGAGSPTQSRVSKARAVPPRGIDRSFTTNFTEPPASTEAVGREEESAAGVPEEWPGSSGGDDQTFGELLGDEPSRGVVEEATGDDQAFGELLDDEPPRAAMPVDNGGVPWSATSGDDAFSQLLGGQQEATLSQQTAAADAEAQGLGDVNAPDGAADSALTGGSGDDLAAAWQAALDDDELLDESNDLDPSTFFGDDDEGLLEDDDFLSEPAQPLPPQPQQQPQQQQQQPRSSQYRPQQTQQQQPSRLNPYGAPSSSFTSTQQHHSRSVGTPDTGLFDIYNTQPSPPIITPQQPQRPPAQTAQSFADKSKGGYQSPYDLPMEVVKPRQRRARGEQQQQGGGGSTGAPKPPPRTSSFGTPSLNASANANANAYVQPQQQQQQPVRPPSSSGSAGSGGGGAGAASGTVSARATPKLAGGNSGFFADLPMTAAKPRAKGSGAYTPGLASPALGGPPGGGASPLTPGVAGGFGVSSRAPPGVGGNSAVQAPVSQQQYQAAAASVWRTEATGASPLAYSLEKPQPPLPIEAVRSMAMSPPRVNGGVAGAGAGAGLGLSPERKGEGGGRYSPANSTAMAGQRGMGYGGQAATSQALPNARSHVRTPPQGLSQAPPPQRPRTQSPSSTMKQAKMIMTQVERPTSAAGAHYAAVPLQVSAAPPAHQQHQQQQSKPTFLPHRRQFSRDLTFLAPTDERSRDPLERWKGTPIFSWNAAGTILTSFPKQTPFYASGQGGPSIKCTAGDIRVQDAGLVLPMEERDAKFPGPLAARGKGRKKEVLAWMRGKIEDLERRAEGVRLEFSVSGEEKKRVEEKVLLWRVMRVFVEHDGVLEGSAKIEEEVRRLLLPDLAQMGAVMDLQTPVSAGGTTPQGSMGEGVDKQVLAQLRQALLEGQRERAVWLAEEKKLWGHAMLIASTMGPDVWKQIIQSFVRSQVKSSGSDARSLAALYQVFAGNSEDCVDELVPPSARAGFQMVSAADGTASGNPLEGLDQWRETLGLVVGNRTAGDGASLVALGRLLSGYGRVEAAGTCFLFARAFVKHSGADDGEAHFVLLGGDRQGGVEGAGPGGEMDAILLTEIYEWASSLAVPSPAVPYIPHLQAYKLLHAQELAAHGLKGKAQGYCDHITSAYTSTTRPSQYYHPVFTQAVADLSAFLSQTPHSEGKGGLFSRPAMKTVSSGAASWFTKFVSGEDDHSRDANAVGSAGGGGAAEESGPFGRVSGEISRSGSGTDLYNPAMMMGGVGAVATPGPAPMASFMPSTAPQGRYAPSFGAGGAQKPLPFEHQPAASRFTPQMSTGLSPEEGHNPMSPTEVTRNLGVPSLDQQLQRPLSAPRSVTSRYAPSPAGLGVQRAGSLDVPRPEASRAASDYGVPYASSLASAPASRRGSAQDPGSQGSYEPSPSLAQEPSAYGYQPSPLQQPVYHAPKEDDGGDGFGPKTNGLKEYELNGPDAETGGYEPPAAAYEPPSYQPYQPEPEADEEEEEAPRKPKKKGIMDLDDDDSEDLAKRAAALKKAQADRAADEAFRKAAEADAERKDGSGKSSKNGGGDKKASGSWLGGWFKKDPTAELNKPIRAKLGEESSFYYDEQLKKWVNKKGGGEESATPPAATPPPPRGPASRMASAASGPPSGPPSRVASAAGLVGGSSRPPTSGSGAPLPTMSPGSGPPSRAATPASLSFQSPPDSAGFAPPAPFAAAAGGALNGDAGPASSSSFAPPSRPATSMSTASNSNSLDDLLAGPRKAGGTVKGKKKTGRYVDVMAK